MALSSNLYALKVQRVDKILVQKSGEKSARMAKLCQFLQGHPFSEKELRRDQEKLFQKSPKK